MFGCGISVSSSSVFAELLGVELVQQPRHQLVLGERLRRLRRASPSRSS